MGYCPNCKNRLRRHKGYGVKRVRDADCGLGIG